MSTKIVIAIMLGLVLYVGIYIETKIYQNTSYTKEVVPPFIIESDIPVTSELGYLTSEQGNLLTTWKGHDPINYADLYSTILCVMETAPFDVEDMEGMIALLMETVATESMFGRYTKQVHGVALGVFQIEPNTYKCIQDNYLRYNERYKPYLLQYKDYSMNNIDNLQYNLPYQIAYALIMYHRHGVTDLPLSTSSVRYAAYKLYWNTMSGSGNYHKYHEDIDKYLKEYYV